jgi:CelD/BcsL family acetyltransferase involved in cellulose biosynthesis
MSQFEKIEKEFDDFVWKWSENPCISSVFIKEGAALSCLRGWSPLIMVVYISNRIVGVAPLATKKKFGIRFARFLFGPNWLMDFVIEDKYREVCVSHILHALTRTLKCKFIDLTFSEESATLKPLEKKCGVLHNYCRTETAVFGGHQIVPVTCTWDEYARMRGKKFRAEARRVERKIRQLGNWRVTCVEQIEQDPEVCDKILRILKLSWKDKFLSSLGIAYDPELTVSLNSLLETEKKKAIFKWRVYFLEHNGTPIAFVLILRDKGTAIINQTAYDAAYKKFSPGIYIINYAIRELFKEGKVKVIDFRADHSYQKTWATVCLSRIDTMIRTGSLLILMERLLVSKTIRHRAEQLKWLLFLKHNENPLIKQVNKDPSLRRLKTISDKSQVRG